MRKATTFVLALLFAFAAVGVAADDVFARGGGGGGSSSGGGAPAGPGDASAAAGSGPAGVAGDPDSPRTIIDEGMLALPRFGTIVTGCTTTNFSAAGGIAPCPVNR